MTPQEHWLNQVLGALNLRVLDDYPSTVDALKEAHGRIQVLTSTLAHISVIALDAKTEIKDIEHLVRRIGIK